jgi:hypothetical protein
MKAVISEHDTSKNLQVNDLTKTRLDDDKTMPSSSVPSSNTASSNNSEEGDEGEGRAGAGVGDSWSSLSPAVLNPRLKSASAGARGSYVPSPHPKPAPLLSRPIVFSHHRSGVVNNGYDDDDDDNTVTHHINGLPSTEI